MNRRRALSVGLLVGSGSLLGQGRADATTPGQRTSLTLRGRGDVVSEQPTSLQVLLTASRPLHDAHVSIEEHLPGNRWQQVASVQVDGYGRGRVRVRVWRSGIFQARFAGSTSLPPCTSGPLTVTARPAGAAVVAPAGAPEPRRRLPLAPEAVGVGANPRISPIGDQVWSSMQGLTWRPGAPVGRAGLRYLQVNYWGFDGYRCRGEMVLNDATVAAAAGAFAELYHRRFPIRQMVLPDRFGPMPRGTHLGADDYASMAADNTSGFNYRYVDGTETTSRILSPHAYGNAIDVNTWENPYVDPDGVFPDGYWENRSRHSSAAFSSQGSAATRAFISRGFSWGASYDDWQHFQRDSYASPGVSVEASHG